MLEILRLEDGLQLPSGIHRKTSHTKRRTGSFQCKNVICKETGLETFCTHKLISRDLLTSILLVRKSIIDAKETETYYEDEEAKGWGK